LAFVDYTIDNSDENIVFEGIMHTSNGLTEKELYNFVDDIDPKNLEKTYHKIIEK